MCRRSVPRTTKMLSSFFRCFWSDSRLPGAIEITLPT